ncbi:MAG: TatD family hydrolase [Nitrososphaerota archaeon]|nr:TatD family hydrolase [Candidatus Geocrenenecus dongiae]
MLIDSHCHIYGYSVDEVQMFKEILIVGVAEDLESSIKNIEISKKFQNIIPFIGIHPWNVEDLREHELEQIIEIIDTGGVRGLGEVGLDKRYRSSSFKKQLELFEFFCQLAVEKHMPMNIHALDSWEECFKIVLEYNVKNVLFHWYNGPLQLLSEIRSNGYLISINPSIKIQPKHRKILESAELDIILTESDGPYLYRGINLNPLMVRDLVKEIADVKNVDPEYVEKIVEKNFSRFLR